MRRKHLLWAAPLALLALLAGVVLALPAFVAAPAHRAAMERLASNLTGRQVRISGGLSLSYLPRPGLTASGITISGPEHEVITARALSLEIDLPALLRGQLAVRALNLDSPDVTFPWPLPGGIGAVAPPPWLAALHAHVDNARIRVGAVTLTGADADLFTGPRGSVSVSGEAVFEHLPVSLSLAIGETGLDGSAPVSIAAQSKGGKADFSGTLGADSRLTGQVTARLPGGLTARARLSVDGSSLEAASLELDQGAARLSGMARLRFSPARAEAELTGAHLDAASLKTARTLWPEDIPAHIVLDAADVTLAGRRFPALRATLDVAAGRIAAPEFSLGLPGGASLAGSAALGADGGLSGQLSLAAPDLAGLTAGFGLPGTPPWPSASLRAELAGSRVAPVLRGISGTLGTDRAGGVVILSPGHGAFRLSFDHLALAPLVAWAGRLPLAEGGLTAEGEVSVAKAEAGPVELTNLLVDAAIGQGVNIRRASASLYGGLAAGSLALGPGYKTVDAEGWLDLPAATPLAALLPAGSKPPAALLAAPLRLVAAADGRPQALSVSATARLGDFTLTASPQVNLTALTAAGAVTVQHPDAIAALKLLGLGEGCSRLPPPPAYPLQGKVSACPAGALAAGLAFPGPGALGLRAEFIATPDEYGARNFVLNAGRLNASGRLLDQAGKLSGQVDAGTLAVPPLPAGFEMPEALPLAGSVRLTAGRVLYAGSKVLDASAATLSLAPDGATLSLARAGLAGGEISGTAALKLAAAAPPALSARLLAEGVEAEALALTQDFPLTLSSGRISATASLSATGYTARAWGATLGGSATVTVSNGVLQGLSLPDLAAALARPRKPGLAKALFNGATPFATLTLAGKLSQGNCTLTQALLTGPAGQIAASGDIDVMDTTLALKLEASPAVTPPLSLTARLLGAWAKPSRSADLAPAYSWQPAAK
ncbi:AsmA family protein [Acidocella sp.]|uniref:AsmA family protein n=1 Tax=Acidocella sp. TaxID=50710 RepID=UPI002620C040|nr:AsmA family protein [Acidocella sp.]